MKTFSQLVIVALSSLFFSSCGSDAPKEVVADTVVEETILKNEGVDQAMIHNILFVNFGKRKDLALLANEAGPDNEFIPSSPDLIAASGLALPGETITLEFKAPEKGNYEFFCSYPGHAGMMKGYLFVK